MLKSITWLPHRKVNVTITSSLRRCWVSRVRVCVRLYIWAQERGVLFSGVFLGCDKAFWHRQSTWPPTCRFPTSLSPGRTLGGGTNITMKCLDCYEGVHFYVRKFVWLCTPTSSLSKNCYATRFSLTTHLFSLSVFSFQTLTATLCSLSCSLLTNCLMLLNFSLIRPWKSCFELDRQASCEIIDFFPLCL